MTNFSTKKCKLYAGCETFLRLIYVNKLSKTRPAYGARPLKRYLQKNVETMVARLILSDGDLSAKDIIYIDLDPYNDLSATVKK